MKRVMRVILAVLAVMALAAPAAAAPPGKGLEVVEGVECTINGETETVDVITSGGIAHWIGDQQYVMTSFTLTFEPADGGDTQTFTQTYGQKRGLSGEAITCDVTFDDPEGQVSIHVVAVPVPPAQ